MKVRVIYTETRQGEVTIEVDEADFRKIASIQEKADITGWDAWGYVVLTGAFDQWYEKNRENRWGTPKVLQATVVEVS